MQAKRIVVNEVNGGVNAQVTARFTVPAEPREMVNFHNIWFSVSSEPENADANNQGTWVLWVKTDQLVTDPNWNDGVVNTEASNYLIVACGVYSASNQAPFNYGSQVKTSRNLNAGQQLCISIINTGITSGNASLRAMLCAHTIRA